MRAIVCTELGPAERLSVQVLPDPQPAPGEIVVDVRAAGLNFPDTLIIEGKYQFQPDLPFVPGGEASGVVSAVGTEVPHFKVGDQVLAMGVFGAFAEKWAVAASSVIPKPPSMEHRVAAGFGLTYGTSFYALKQRADLQPGETLLVLGAAGGVGSAAVDLGKAMGARVIAAASTDDKLAYAGRSGCGRGHQLHHRRLPRARQGVDRGAGSGRGLRPGRWSTDRTGASVSGLERPVARHRIRGRIDPRDPAQPAAAQERFDHGRLLGSLDPTRPGGFGGQLCRAVLDGGIRYLASPGISGLSAGRFRRSLRIADRACRQRQGSSRDRLNPSGFWRCRADLGSRVVHHFACGHRNLEPVLQWGKRA